MSAMRSCIKTACRWPAAAILSYRYATGEVWLSDLGADHPATHDLCPHHADDLKVPRGWTLVDDRQPIAVVHEPSAAEIVERVATLRDTVERRLEQGRPPEPRKSRYDGLLDDLPVYSPNGQTQAAETDHPSVSTGSLAEAGQSHPDEDTPAKTVGVGSSTANDWATAVRDRLSISHEMAPVARELLTRHRADITSDAPLEADGGPDGEDDRERAVVLTLPLLLESGRTDDPPRT